MTALDESVEHAAPQQPAARGEALLVSSRRLQVLDEFRIPYEVDPRLARDGVHQLRSARGAALYWPASSAPQGGPVAATLLGAGGEAGIPMFAHVASDAAASAVLACGDWRVARAVTAAGGAALGSVWRSDEGGVVLPFDPDEVIENYRSERYGAIRSGKRVSGARHAVMTAYYRIKPLMPRSVQIFVRRQFSLLQGRAAFPRWPVEPALHDFMELIVAMAAHVAGEPLPSIAAWPYGHRWALVLTHDVESAEGMDAIEPIVEIEAQRGMRSSWNVVAADYAVCPDQIRQLHARGCEVGVHGYSHDCRDLATLSDWQTRLPLIRETARSWGAVGFRSPALHRQWEWMPWLELDYDSSSPDTDPYEPRPGGCCSWLPFFNGRLVELPITLPQDHTLFVILRRDGRAAWVDKARYLRGRGGMALINTHPDYLVDACMRDAYRGFVAEFHDDAECWTALPREVSAWWRRRAASQLERDIDGWRVVGPADTEARVEYLGGTW